MKAKRLCRKTWIFLRFFGRRLYNRWNDDSVFFSAAAISFNVLITILPLGLLIISLSGLAFQESQDLQHGLTNWLDTANPLIPDSTRSEIETAILSGRTGIPGVIGFAFLLWLVSRLFGTIRTAFDRIFDVPEGRNIFLGKLYDFFLALLVGVCFLSAVVFSTMAKLMVDSPLGDIVSRWPLIGSLTGGNLAQILGISFTLLLFFTLFKAAPNRSVSLRQALLATAIAAVFTALGTEVYIWVISNPGWGLVYGSMASLMATFFLLYWECVILLGAAEVSQIAHEWRTSVVSWKNIR
ncbi:MAG: YihY/virulence factor BrkB family protein [Candidatus Fermentibacteraceae bacterium]|nr:YihY/virulence factor BrkB family protein [Candidatus Fermentibacteraceae bacterium]